MVAVDISSSTRTNSPTHAAKIGGEVVDGGSWRPSGSRPRVGRAQPSVTSARNMRGPLFHMRLYHDETAYVLIGAVHPLELIEVQVGSYLGEDDILRLEDVYRRHAEA